MALADDVEWIATAASAHADAGERVSGVLVAEPRDVGRVYLCAFESETGTAWLALDAAGRPIDDRVAVHDAVSLAALCEVAEESAGGGDLPALRARLAELRATDAPEGIEAAEAAAAALAGTLQPEPRLATTAYLDELGAAARRLEHALGDDSASPLAAALQQALPAVEQLAAEVVRLYKGPLA
jgi:hypothetical protein